jgi:hypothetical protein
MLRIAVLLLVAGLAVPEAAAAGARDVALPSPVAQHTEQWADECRAQGLGELIVTEHYPAQSRYPEDVNADGRPDYFVYKCMFGCSARATAFLGLGTPCAWGNLLLSEENGYRALFLPGMVSAVTTGARPRIAISRPKELRVVGNFCQSPFPDYNPHHVYELRDGRFQLFGLCPETGCRSLLAAGAPPPAVR